MNLKPKLEKFAVLAAIGAILWSARLLFIFAIGDHWFGTLGITSVLFGSLTYLSWTGKLGRFGQIYKEILCHKISKKLTKVRLVFAVLLLVIFGSMSAGMHASKTIYQSETQELMDWVESENPEIMGQEKLIEEFSEVMMEDPQDTTAQTVIGLLVLAKLAVTDFEVFSTIVGASNLIYGGQLLHLVDIILVEEVEILGILFFVSWIQRKPKTLTRN